MKKKGFTLIELLVVIAIIGILATIGLVALNGAREKARDATRKSDISQVKTALVLYADDNESGYPPYTGVFTTDLGDGVLVTNYISKLPSDPQLAAGHAEYTYESCDNTAGIATYVLYAQLESPADTYFYVAGDGSSGDKATEVPACTSF